MSSVSGAVYSTEFLTWPFPLFEFLAVCFLALPENRDNCHLLTPAILRINSTILANTMKNKRKAEKKKRALERRMSEGDACSLEVQSSSKVEKKMTGSSSLDLSNIKNDWESEEHEDSGLASSFEENLVLTGENGGEGKTKAKKMTKKRSKQFVMSNELIFDLDI